MLLLQLLFWSSLLCLLAYFISLLPFVFKKRTGLSLLLAKPGLRLRAGAVFLLGLVLFSLTPVFRIFVWDQYRLGPILCRINAKFAEWVFGVKCIVQGLEELPEPPFVAWFNHQSSFDNVFAGLVLPKRISLLAKSDLKKIPCYWVGHTLTGGWFIDRDNRELAIHQNQMWEEVVRKNRLCACVSPEGTRNKIHKTKELVLDFKKGPAIMALGLGFPIVIYCVHPGYNQNVVFGDRTGLGFFERKPMYMRIFRVDEFDPLEYDCKTIDEKKAVAPRVCKIVRDCMKTELEKMVADFDICATAFVM